MSEIKGILSEIEDIRRENARLRNENEKLKEALKTLLQERLEGSTEGKVKEPEETSATSLEDNELV